MNTGHSKRTEFDVVIIGGGPVGLCLARSLSGHGMAIALVEKQPLLRLANPGYDGREIALTHHSYGLMKKLNLFHYVPEDSVSLIKDAKVLNGRSSYALHFDHSDAGRENLGFMMSNHMIRKAAFDAAAACEDVHMITETEVTGLETDIIAATVTLADGRILTASLAIAADSRFSPTRDMMGVETQKLDFKRTCIVCRMEHEEPHDDTAYECFHYDRTLAVLPLNGRCSSVVITLPATDSAALLALDPEEFSTDIASRIDNRLGRMKLVSKLFPYPLVATYAQSFHARRFALAGDAAVGMHPVTAHGFNLGLRGQDTLAREIVNARQTGIDTGSSEILRRYDRQHRKITRPLYLGTNALVNLYTKETPPARLLRHALLRLGNGLPPAKRLIMDQLTEIDAA